MIDKEFVPYQQSLELKELGFDEPCFGYFSFGDELIIEQTDTQMVSEGCCLAPLFSQVFKWFRDNHDLVHRINRDGGYWICAILDLYDEEAELECLRKLIQIAKGKTA